MINLENKKIKLYILQKRYKEISKSIFILQDHINNLFKFYFIDYTEKNFVLLKLFNIGKNINSLYNKCINDEIETDDSNSEESLDINIHSKNNYNSLDELDRCFENQSNFLQIENKPLENFIIEINEIVEQYGYGTIINTINKNIGEIRYNLIDAATISFLEEINDLCTVSSITRIDTENNIDFGKVNYKLEIPEKFSENDHLKITKLLFFKINNNIFKLVIFFINDLTNINIKSSQLVLPHLYEKKK